MADQSATDPPDLTSLTFLDSTGLTALLAAHSAATARGCALVLNGITPWLQTRFNVTGLTAFFGLDNASTASTKRNSWHLALCHLKS